MDIRLCWGKVVDFFGLGQQPEDFPGELEPAAQPKHPKPRVSGKEKRVISIYQKQGYRIMLYSPDSFNEVKDIADQLKAGKPIIVNLEGLGKETPRRVIDFLSGAVYGLNGSIQKIGEAVFIFTPENIQLDGELLKNNLDASLWK